MRAGRRKGRGLNALLWIVFVLMLLLIVLAAALLIIPMTERPDKRTVEGSADWMATLKDELPLSEIALPGTHDSATQYVQLAFFSKCQSLDIADQLKAGFRYLDIRLGTDEDPETLLLMHGFTLCKTGVLPKAGPLTLETVLEQCYAFLEEHPTESLAFAVKQEHGDLSVEQFQTLLDAQIQKNEDFWCLSDQIPTLGEARGKLVLLRRYEDEANLGARAGIPFLWEDQPGNEDTGLNTAAAPNGGYTLWVQDRYEYSSEDKWTAFVAGMENGAQAGDISLNFLSTKGSFAYGHPYHFAKALNARLIAQPLSGHPWVAVDFGSASLAAKIYKLNF